MRFCQFNHLNKRKGLTTSQVNDPSSQNLMSFCEWDVRKATLCVSVSSFLTFKILLMLTTRILLHGECFVFSLAMATKHFDSIILYITLSLLPHAWFILSFASLEQPPLAHFLKSLASAHRPYGWQMTLWKAIRSPAGKKKKNRNWIQASVGSLICHLFNIDVHYVYGLFGCLLFSGPARPVRSATWGSGPLIMPFWLMDFIV